MMDADEALIPERLRERLEAVRPALEQNASIRRARAESPDDKWRLRYREDVGGVRMHRSLLLGDGVTASAVRRLIESWREERRLAQERAREAERVEREREKARRKSLRQAFVELAGGGGIRRRKTGKAFDEATASGPFALFAFAMEGEWKRPSPKGGRPPKSGLW